MTVDPALRPEKPIAAIEAYLKQQFPSLLIKHAWDPSVTSERFFLFTEDQANVVHIVIVSGEFLREYSTSSVIPRVLNGYELVAAMKANGKRAVTLWRNYVAS